MALLKLGNVVATPAALQLCETNKINPLLLLGRHASGNWGNLDADGVAANVAAIQHDLRLFSSYNVGSAKVWVITEADRSSTCLLLPEEY
jgi:hypothetical protein